MRKNVLEREAATVAGSIFEAPLREQLLRLGAADVMQLQKWWVQLCAEPCDSMDALFDAPEKRARFLGRTLLNPDSACLDWALDTHLYALDGHGYAMDGEGVGLFNPVWMQSKTDLLREEISNFATVPLDLFDSYGHNGLVPKPAVMQALDDAAHAAALRENLLRLADVLPAQVAADVLVIPALWYGDAVLWQRMQACGVVPLVMPLLTPAPREERAALATVWLGRLLDNFKQFGGGPLAVDEVFFDAVNLAAPDLKHRMTAELLLSGRLHLAPDFEPGKSLEDLLLLSGDVRAVAFLRGHPALAAAIRYPAHCRRPTAELHRILRLLSAAHGLPITIGAGIPPAFGATPADSEKSW